MTKAYNKVNEYMTNITIKHKSLKIKPNLKYE